MANYKSFVFNSTNDSQPLVTPSFGRHHIYLNPGGQIEVINHLGEIVSQNFGGASGTQTVVGAGANITVGGTTSAPIVGVVDGPSFGSEVSFFGGAHFASAGPIIMEDGLISTSDCQISSISTLIQIRWELLVTAPPPLEGKMYYSAGTGLMICTGSTAADWKRL
jgi:hypothetical protein